MNLEKSAYNIIVEKHANGDELIFNTLTSAMGLLESHKLKLLYDIETLDEKSLSEDELESVHVMAQNGFLVEKGYSEKDFIKVNSYRNRYNKDSLILTIAPTLACNLACPYCYEKGVEKLQNMMPDVQKQVIEFIKRKAKEAKHLIITWYGGEPLLAVDVIATISAEIISFCKANEISYSSSIVTNGTLLNDEKANVLRDICSIDRIQVTIDGMENTHNLRRGNCNINSFRTILENVEKYRKRFNFAIRMNIDKSNANEAMDLFNYFEKNYKWDNTVKYYFSRVRNYKDKENQTFLYDSCNCLSPAEYDEFSIKIYEYLYDKKYYNYFDNKFPTRASVSCSAIGENYYVIDPDGDICNCWILIGNKNKIIGNVAEPDKLINNKFKLEWMATSWPNECEECKLLPLCQGGCTIHYENGNSECRYSEKALVKYLSIYNAIHNDTFTGGYTNENVS